VKRLLAIAAVLAGLVALAQAPIAEPRQPALRVWPSQANGLPPILAGECTGAALLGSRGEAVTFTRTTAGSHCTRTDGGQVWLDAGQPAVSGGALAIRPAVTNLLPNSEQFTSAYWSALDNTGTPPVATASDGGAEFLDPRGGNNATKLEFAAVGAAQYNLFRATNFSHPGGAGTTSIWLRTASGTATIPLRSSISTAVGTCAVTASWSRCFNSQTGASGSKTVDIGANVSVGDPTGPAATVYAYMAQFNAGATAQDYCGPTGAGSATCNAETATVANPLAAAPANPTAWCMGADRLYPSGGTWDVGLPANETIFAFNTLGAANSAAMYVRTTGLIEFAIWNASGTLRYYDTDSALAAGWHSVYGCTNNGTMSIWVDGVSVPITIQGAAGDGIISTQPATVYFGNSVAGDKGFGGYVGGFRVVRGVTP